jgi:hypothetical protein
MLKMVTTKAIRLILHTVFHVCYLKIEKSVHWKIYWIIHVVLFLLKLKNLHIENWNTLPFTTLPSTKHTGLVGPAQLHAWSHALLISCVATGQRPGYGLRPGAWARRAWPTGLAVGRRAARRSRSPQRQPGGRGREGKTQAVRSRSLVASLVVGLQQPTRAGRCDGWRKKAGLGRRAARWQTGLGEERHSDNRAGQRGEVE